MADVRVTHVITRLIIGGAQENTVASVLGLRDRPGFEPDLVSGPSPGAEGSLEERFADCPHLLTVLPSLVRALHPLKDWLAFRQLTRLFWRTQPEIVHTHSGKAGILGRLAARRAGIRVIIHTIHGPSFGAFQGPVANALFRSAERRAAQVTTHFVTVAHAMTSQYLAAGIGQPGQYTRILSGFPLAPYLRAQNDPHLRAQLGLGSQDFVVGILARLFKLKGHDDLLAVAPALVKEFPHMKFLLVGDGPLRPWMEGRLRDSALRSHFIFAGLVRPEAVPAHVGIMDMLVHLSRREGLPRALPQALAAGRPVMAYDCDGADEVCFDNETGFLVRPGDLAGVIERVGRLARDPALRTRLGQRGRQFVSDNFAEEQMVDRLQALYLKLTAPG